jgi:hypothetical protein
MSTWEERMSQRAKARMAAAEAAAEADRIANDPHGDHHEHLDGTAVYCSCGEFRGVTCVAFSGEPAAVSCKICGKEGVVALGG